MKGDLALSALAVLVGVIAWEVPDNLLAHVVGLVMAGLGVWLASESVLDRLGRRSRRR